MADTLVKVNQGETRDELLRVPNLFEHFCNRTAMDMRSRGSSSEPPTVSFASLIITLLVAVAFLVFHQTRMAKATFIFFGLLLLWTAWGVIVRSSEQVSQKADDIRSGKFPPVAASFAIARLKWWNHLISPMRWGKHSRLYDRRSKLERKIEELNKKIAESMAATPPQTPYTPPDDKEIMELAGKISTYSDRNTYELETAKMSGEVPRLRSELLLYEALKVRLDEMAEKLEKIEQLTVEFHSVSTEDLSQIVSEATQMLEQRRALVLDVDAVDPDDFIDLVTVRSAA